MVVFRWQVKESTFIFRGSQRPVGGEKFTPPWKRARRDVLHYVDPPGAEMAQRFVQKYGVTFERVQTIVDDHVHSIAEAGPGPHLLYCNFIQLIAVARLDAVFLKQGGAVDVGANEPSARESRLPRPHRCPRNPMCSHVVGKFAAVASQPKLEDS